MANYFYSKDEVEILKRVSAGKDGKQYVFYDVAVGPVIIKSCKVAKGKNGYFLSLPSIQSASGSYYPMAIMTREMNKVITDILVNRETPWEKTEIKTLTFSKGEEHEAATSNEEYPF